MKIQYLNCDGKKKLFSFFTHDYNEEYIDDKFYMIDGGFSYNRYSGGTLESAEIKEVIKDIRNQFVWGQNYDKEGNKLPKTINKLLKDLTTDHIIAILKYFTELLDKDISVSWKIIHLIFLEELNYRYNNKLY